MIPSALSVNGAVQSVHGATRKNLLKIKGFSEVKVEKIKEAIQKCLVSPPFPPSPPSPCSHGLINSYY